MKTHVGEISPPQFSGNIGKIPILTTLLALALLLLGFTTPASAETEPGTAPCGRFEEKIGVIRDFSDHNPVIFLQPAGTIGWPTNEQTVIVDESAQPLAYSALNVGDKVLIKFCPATAGTPNSLNVFYVKRLEQASTTPGECTETIKRDGKLTEVRLSPPSVRIDGLLYSITNSTQLLAANESEVELSAFSVGESVFVEYCASSVNIIPVAVVLRKKSAPNCDAEFGGQITASQPAERKIRVGETWVKVPNTAEIIGLNGGEAGFDALMIGRSVKVKGCPATTNTGIFEARRVQLLSTNTGEGQRVELQGAIASINGEEKTFTINGFTIVTSSATIIKDRQGSIIPFSSLAVAQVVKVLAERAAQVAIFPAPPPVFMAITVQVIGTTQPPPPPNERFYVQGFLQDVSLETGMIVVAERPVQTDDATVYNDRNSTATLTLADLIPGDFLTVEGTRTNSGVPIARKVTRSEPVGVPFTKTGVVSAISEDGILTINNLNVRLTDDTQLRDREGNSLELSDFTIGNNVRAEGLVYPAPRGAVARIVVKLAEPPPPPAPDDCKVDIQFIAAITEVIPSNNSTTPNRVLAGGNSIHVGEKTEIRNAEGRPITLAALQVGDIIKVEGKRLPIATDAIREHVAACSIHVRRDGNGGIPELNRLMGRVDSINTPTLTFVVRNSTVVTTPETKFTLRRNDTGTTPTFASLHVGDMVIAIGNRTADGRFAARIVNIQEERVLPDPVVPVRTQGLITAINLPDSITVDETIITIDGPVEVHGLLGIADRLADLQVGDLVVVHGVRKATNGPIVARHIHVRGSVISAINHDERTLQIADTTVRATTDTVVLERGTGPIPFSDLAVGDLIRVGGNRVSPNVIRARVIERLQGIYFSGPIGGHDPIVGDIEDGSPVIGSEDNQDTFGFLNLPDDAFPVRPNTLYEVTATISSNVADRTRVPTLRVRANNQSYQKAAEYIITAGNQVSLYAPGTTARGYKGYFVPAQAPLNAEEVYDDWFLALDLINVGGFHEPRSRVRLHNLNVRPIALSRVQVVDTLLEQSFDSTTEGWVSGGLPGVYTLPIAGSGATGTLDLAPPDRNSLGWWTTDTGVAAEANTLYRGRFLVRADSDAVRVPTIRLRLNLRSYQLASLAVIASNRNRDEAPTADGRLYDVYLQIPAGAIMTDEAILASFDLYTVGSQDDLIPVSLDHFTLEKVTIRE